MAGSRKGVPNKTSLAIADRLKRWDCDPFWLMAHVCVGRLPCPICNQTKRAKYRIDDSGSNRKLVLDPDGQEMDCRSCYATGYEIHEAKLRVESAKELAQYVVPKRKAVEHTGPNGDAIQHAVKMIEVSFVKP